MPILQFVEPISIYAKNEKICVKNDTWYNMKYMNFVKCDICKKKLKGNPVRAGIGYFVGNDFCSKCAKPILVFLKKHKLLDNEKNYEK